LKLFFFNLACFAVSFSVLFPEQAGAADPLSIVVLGAVREAAHAAEVEADQKVTAYRLALTTLVEANRKAATKVQTNRRGSINDDGARPEEETTKNERDLGNTTATTSERRRDPMDLIDINEKRRANEVGHLSLKAAVDRVVEVRQRDRAGNMNQGEKRKSEKTDIATEMEWTTGLQGIKDATIGIGDNARVILYLVYIDFQDGRSSVNSIIMPRDWRTSDLFAFSTSISVTLPNNLVRNVVY